MATPYRFIGDSLKFYPHLGFTIEPGQVCYLEGRPPEDGLFALVEAEPVAAEPSVKAGRGQRGRQEA